MNRILSFLLAALLVALLCVPAMGASESADERLGRVTQAVKNTLDLDTEIYTDFHGDVYEQELGTVWSLWWSGDGVSLSVEALDDGTVVGYQLNDSDSETYYYRGNTLPTLPKVDASAAKAAAEAFLARVLDGKTERVELGEPNSAGRLYGSASCSFSGPILLNGLSSPLDYSLTVRGSDNVVTSFHRDALATSYLGGIPSAKPAVSQSDAAKALRGTLKLELVYVTDGEDGKTAVLRYVPKDFETVYVDAQTGKLLTPDMELYGTNAAGDAMAPAAMAEEAKSVDRGLTETELAGVQKLEGVLDKEALDKLVRAESAYKLDGYTLAPARYSLVKDGEDERVLCALRYALPEDEDGWSASRSFTVDARTGAVESLYSFAPYDKDKKSAVSAANAQSTAEAFLKRFTAHAGEFALYRTDDSTADGAPFYGFTFVRKTNGVFFPENACTIQIDRISGAVAGVSFNYTEGIVFDANEGVVSADAALDAWMASYDVALAYRSTSKELDRSVAAEAKLIDMGYTRFRKLLLTYALERETYSPGVDAKTGKLVSEPEWNREIAYSDVSGHWAASEIDRLAQCGIGYDAGSFRPDKALTQWELVALLASTQGLRLDPENADADARSSAYETVYRMGALTRGERKDDAPVTRALLTKCLLNAAGVESVARLSGIFTCSYADRSAIPAESLGYAALAQGFGLARGETFDGDATATRAVAAVMLCRLMERAQ